MVVKIDMDMPKSCSECKFPSNMECFLRYEAWISGYFNENRHERCPLREVKE